jgi:2-polyprenyl-3-methyl-5-hydroxy-6-metoxy-1,4-benzoquinol methylase
VNATDAYFAVRQREGRVLDDGVVRELPFSGDRTAHPAEWRIRARGLRRVLAMFKDRPRTILDIGCGNGWYSARLAEAGHSVSGLDTGTAELEQATRVFAHLPIRWLSGDPWSTGPEEGAYDVILFAASLQYFPDLPSLFTRSRALLNAHGEVIISDSPLYRDAGSAAAASERSRSYYASVGVPDMTAHYHHHTIRAIQDACPGSDFRYKPPRSGPVALMRGRYQFPIVRIRW